ncbi:hypothetical protein ACSJMR_10390 [Acinetobacter pecorum]|uniref:hypothetical protein n=1 Tax=Acinetobacter pecorum TaxID=2762215 RepID=UPI003EE5414A
MDPVKFFFDDCYFILQPYSDQAKVIAKFLKENTQKKIVGVLLEKEAIKKKSIYDDLIILKSYGDLPEDKGMIIPTGAPSTEALLKKGDIKIGNIIMNKDSLLVYDKISFLEKCRKVSLPIPLELDFKTLEESSFPLFFKEKNEKGGGVRGRANSANDLNDLPYNDLIFQELIESKGTYGVAFLAKDGKLITSTPHFEEESYPQTGGSATLIKSSDDLRLVELTQKFVESFNYSGWGLAEFKYCNKRKDFVFMEVNGKFWASCFFTFKNNPLFLKLLFNIEITNHKIRSMLFIDRLLRTGLLNFIKVLFKNINSYKVLEGSLLKSFILGILRDLRFIRK